MKKIVCLLTVFAVLLSFSACSDTGKKTENSSLVQTEIDVDLSVLSGTVVYSEVYNMINTPENYLGKTVKIKGAFSIYEDKNTGKRYYACLIKDATACCSQGIEFTLTNERKYPEEYPDIGDQITVTGKFGTYKEGEQTYCNLENAELTI